ncbi:hypothetical protein ACFVMC_28160 [Nocardia sp. NPDC127579]|uniref:hypothetical protein n=1 Tax=Nocardia sp. NPDC127579 TaxID=3345402 RepID=UPI00363575E4
MRDYVFVETIAPAAAGDPRLLRDAVKVLATGSATVTVALLEGAVLGAVLDHPVFTTLSEAGAVIGVDALSLEQWGYDASDVPGRELVTMDWLLERLLDDNSTVVWH